ncbi:hypothetical protein HDV05_004547, partial [Chytridiales sp. JEL 0842]
TNNNIAPISYSPASTSVVTIPIPVTLAFLQKYGLENYNPSARYTTVPICAHVKDFGSQWATDGCRLLSLNTTFAVCECTHLTSFTLGVAPAPASVGGNSNVTPPGSNTPTTPDGGQSPGSAPGGTAPTPTPTPDAGLGAASGSNAGVIAGAVIGSLVGVVLIVGAAYQWNTIDDVEDQCPKWETYDVKALRNKVFTNCRNLNDEYPDMSLTDTFQVNLCMSRYNCGEGYFQITRKDQDACQLAFKQEVSWDDHVDQIIKRDIGPDGFWLKFDGPERLTPTDWRHQGNCTYKLPFRLSTTGIFNVTLAHIYDNFTANNEAEFYKWHEPKFDIILQDYSLDVCADVGCKNPAYSDLHHSADLPVCGRDDTYQGVFLRMADPPSPREEWLLKSYGNPYIWHPLSCRIPHTFFRNESFNCFESNRTILFLGDSQSRGQFDLVQFRLDAHDVPFIQQKMNKPNYHRDDVSYASVIGHQSGPNSRKLRLKYRWDTFLSIFGEYARGSDDRFDGYNYEADRYLQEIDVAFVNTGHWPAAGRQLGGFWSLRKYTSYVEYLLNTMKQINKQQQFYGGKVTRFIWVGAFSVGMFKPEGSQISHYLYYKEKLDHRTFYNGNFMTSSWVIESPDGAHFDTTPGYAFGLHSATSTTTAKNIWLIVVSYIALEVCRGFFAEAIFAAAPARASPFIHPSLLVLLIEVVKCIVCLVLASQRFSTTYAHLFGAQALLYFINNCVYYATVQMSSAANVSVLLHLRLPITGILHHLTILPQQSKLSWLALAGIYFGVVLVLSRPAHYVYDKSIKPSTLAAKLDACGVCNGNNSTCTDCDGVVGGTAKRDNCGVCNGDGSTCGTAITDVNPNVIVNSGKALVDVRGTGFLATQDMMQITFDTVPVPRANILEGTNQGIRLKLPQLASALADGVNHVTVKLTFSWASPSTLSPLEFDITLVRETTTVVSVSGTTFYTGATADADLTFTGTNFFANVPTSEPRCVFATRPPFVSNLVIASDTSASCRLPKPIEAAEVKVYLSYKLLFNKVLMSPDTAIPTSDGNDITLTFKSQAPQVLSTKFSDSGAQIIITFDTSIQTSSASNLGDIVNCEKYVITDGSDSTAILARANNPTDCQAVFPRSDTLTLSVSALVPLSGSPIPGASIGFLPNTLFKADAKFSDAVTGKVTIQAPTTTPLPTLDVRAQGILASCTDFVIEVSPGNTGGRELKASTLTFTASAADATDAALQTKLDTFAQDFLTSGTRRFVIPAAELVARTYTFSWSITNFLDGVTMRTFQVEKVASDLVPNIVITAPTAKMSPKQPIQLTATINAGCSNQQPQFQWSFHSGGPPNFNYNIPAADAARPTLSIPPLSLPPSQTYTFKILAKVGSGPEYSYFATVSTIDEVMVVSAGNSMKAYTNNIKLSASVQNTAFNTSELTLTYQWSCLDANNFPCVDGSNNLLTFGNTQELSLSNLLSAGEYRVFVSVTNTATSVSGSSSGTSLTIIGNPVPNVNIQLSTNQISSYSTNFIISAAVDPSSVSSRQNLRYSWKSETSCSGSTIPYSSIDLSTSLETDVTAPQLKFKRGALTPGASYCLSLAVTDTGNAQAQTSFSTVTFSVAEGPTGGYCNVVGAATGTEFTTQFKFGCFNWVTGDGADPIIYQWEVQRNGESTWNLLGPSSPKSSLQSTFPAGQYNIRATITDQLKGVNTQPQVISITVNAASLRRRDYTTAPSYTYFNNTVLANYNTYKDVDQVMLDISVLIQVVMSPSTAADLADALRSGLINLVRQIIVTDGLTINALSTGPFFAETMLKLSSANLDSTLRPLVFTVLSNIMNQVNTATKTTGDCMGTEYAGKIIQTLSVLLDGMTEDSSYDSSIGDGFEALKRNYEECVHRTMACNQAPLTVTSSSLEMSLGVIPVNSTTSTLCGVQVSDTTVLDSLTDASGCIRYSCGKTSKQKAVIASTGEGTLTDKADVVVTLDFKDTNNNIAPISYSPTSTARVKVPITVTLAFLQKYGLENYNPTVNYTNFPVCAHVKDFESEWATDGCRLLSLSNTLAICECTHLTSFTLGIASAAAIEMEGNSNITSTATGTTPTPTPTSPDASETPTTIPNPVLDLTVVTEGISIYVIAGAAGGAVVGAVLIFGSYKLIARWRRRRRLAAIHNYSEY